MNYVCTMSSSHKIQIWVSLRVNIISLCYGMIIGWLSPVLPILLSKDSPLATGPLTVEQSSWIGSLYALSALFGIVIFTFISQKFGTKFALNFLGLPLIGFWLFIYFGNTYHYLYIARFFGGFTGGAIFASVPLYNAEIAEPELRGQLGSFMLLFNFIGILLSYILGTYLEYYTVPIPSVILPLVYSILIYYVPETPQRLIKSYDITGANKSYRYYRGISHKQNPMPVEYREEFEAMISQQYTITSQADSKLTINDFKSKEAINGLLIGIALMFFNQFTGSFAVVNYAASIFEDAGSSLSPNVSSIIIAVTQIIACLISASLVDRIGRRILIIVSLGGIMVGFAVCGTFSYFRYKGFDTSSFTFIPIVSLSFVIFMSCLGIVILPFVILAEILPVKLRYVGSLLCLLSLFLFTFLVLKYIPFMIRALELHGCMWVFSGISIVGVIFAIFVLKETKGKCLPPL